MKKFEQKIIDETRKELGTEYEEIKKSAETGDCHSMARLSLYYLISEDTSQNTQNAFYWCRKAVDTGCQDAKGMLGALYLKGIGCDVDYKAAFEMLSEAAETKDVTAIKYLGDMYYNGQYVKQDMCKAFSFYKQAAQMKFPDAITLLAVMYYKGEGTHQDYKKAFRLFRKTCKEDPLALFYTGCMYLEGHGIKKDLSMGMSMIMQAAKNGCSDAYLKLSRIFSKGRYMDANLETAYELCKIAVQLDNSEAESELTELYKKNRQG